MKSNLKKRLMLGMSCLATAVVVAPGAMAAPETGGPPTQANNEVGEIVVTGVQRREQALVDVPIAMTSLSGDAVQKAGIQSVTDLQTLAPGLIINRSTGFVRPVIRGVGSQVTSLGADANIAMYLDGVYRPNQQSNQFSLADIERVEVLKGPQGTLFGRNATGGAIVITTKKPSLTETSGNLMASYGRFNEREFQGYITTPLTNTVGVSFSADHHEDDGYVRDVPLNRREADHHETLLRTRILYQPNDRFSLIGSAYHLQFSDNTGAAFDILNRNTQNPTAPFFPDPREVAQTFIPYIKVNSWGSDVQAQYKFDGMTLKSITSYAEARFDLRSDLDGTTVNTAATTFRTIQKTFTQELTLGTDGPGRFQWNVGAFLYRDRGSEPFLLSTTNVFTLSATLDTDSWALFGEAEYEIIDGLFLSGGLRYSKEKRDFAQDRAVGTDWTGSKSWDAVTPRAAIRYALTHQSNIYASYSEGFKSGTYNVTANGNTPVDPEHIRAYEVGYKYAAGRTSFDVSAFYYNYKDLQVQALPPGATLTTLINAGVVHTYGLDAEFTTRLAENWDLHAGASYLHAKYDSFPNASIFVPLPSGHGNASVAPYDASGKYVEFSPKFSASVSLTYTKPVGDGSISSTATASYTDTFFYDPSNRLTSPSYVLLNGVITWKPRPRGFEFSVWGQNLTDRVYPQIITFSTAGDRIAYARPRTYGVRVGYEF
jgi:iron complex outermembrane receptor protein